MPALDDILSEMFRRRDYVPNNFLDAIPPAQRNLVKQLITALGSLKTEDGKLVADTGNLAKIESISSTLNADLFTGDYRKALESFIKEFSTQATITNKYFEKAFGNVFDAEDKFYKELTANSQKQALQLLANNAIDANFIAPLKQQLTASITTGATYADTVTSLRLFIEGSPEVDGTLLRYVKQVARDTYSVADRTYTNVISDRLGAQWFFYQGGEMADSRDFCIERHGKYFHKKEIEAMAAKDWQGKMKGTNERTIFVMAGGYNCEHSFLPVSEFAVPKDVIQRNIENGNYQLAA
jgi:hypothetical protein